MSEWRLPQKQKSNNILEQSKYSSKYMDSIAGILTCLSAEASRNELTSMSFVLTEIADGLADCAGDVDTLIRWAERQKERQDEQDKKN